MTRVFFVLFGVGVGLAVIGALVQWRREQAEWDAADVVPRTRRLYQIPNAALIAEQPRAVEYPGGIEELFV